MTGRHVTDRQVRLYMDDRRNGLTQVAAAARSGLSERTGRRIERSPALPSQKPPRRYRTQGARQEKRRPSIKRKDPQTRLFRLRCTARLPQPHAGATAVFVDELDAGSF